MQLAVMREMLPNEISLHLCILTIKLLRRHDRYLLSAATTVNQWKALLLQTARNKAECIPAMRNKQTNKKNSLQKLIGRRQGHSAQRLGKKPPRLHLLPSFFILMSKQFNGGQTLRDTAEKHTSSLTGGSGSHRGRGWVSAQMRN